MKISLVSVSVSDQDHALDFYARVLGFEVKVDMDLGGGARWLTLVSPLDPDGPELLLEPNAGYPAMKALKDSLVRDGIPFTAFEVADIEGEFARLCDLGVTFKGPPMEMDGTKVAVFDDTCGNLIQIYQLS